jgi:hypothetical protein
MHRAVALWSAPAKRSGDGAFERTKGPLHSKALRACESGVAASLYHRTPKCLAVPPAGTRVGTSRYTCTHAFLSLLFMIASQTATSWWPSSAVA